MEITLKFNLNSKFKKYERIEYGKNIFRVYIYLYIVEMCKHYINGC